MGGKGSGRLSNALMPKQPEKAMQSAEEVVLKVLEGTMKLVKDSSTEIRARYAFQLYLKRIPAMTEEVGDTGAQNIINIIKSHAGNTARNTSNRAQLGVQPEADVSS